ncbi:MAG: ABC transporter permease, partial [bacterium]|nr:ABC transporter permease [bacterium]
MKFFKINAQPGKVTSILLSATLFVLCIGAYLVTAHVRHEENPQDKLVPTLSKMAEGFYRTAFEADRKGEYRLWVDTLASGKRFLISLALIVFAVLLGLHMGVL